MVDSVKVSVYSRVPGSPCSQPLFYWYKEGTEADKKAGHHIIVDDILDEEQLLTRVKVHNYARIR